METPAKTAYTAQEAAEKLSVSTQTVIRWAKEGKIPYCRPGHGYRFDASVINALLNPTAHNVHESIA